MNSTFDSASAARAATLRPYEAEPIRILAPTQQRAPLVLASPHSGSFYHPAFLAASRLDPLALRRSEDCYVDQIFAGAPAEIGVPLLAALFPRAYLDPNREPYELDPGMFRDALPGHVRSRTDRVRAGFGTVARVVSSGTEIYRERLYYAEAEARIATLYEPYHHALQRLVEATVARFGGAILIDCHSMPSIGGPSDTDAGQTRHDIVLGDRHGASCAPRLADAAEAALARLGFNVARNDPYAGAHTLKRYGQPKRHVHALQIEINRALYVDEATLAKLPGFDELGRKMMRFLHTMAALDPTAY
ncbi:MAG: N-formylglutamate amidohydrolase [Alphaproteobacteria bacterium]